MTAAGLMFLAGAPTVSALDWSEDGLLDVFTVAVRRYLGHAQGLSMPPPATQIGANWRAVQLHDQWSRGNFDQSCVTNVDSTHNHVEDDDEDDFLEHSFAVHAHVHSSQLASQPSVSRDESITSLTDESSILSTSIMNETTLYPSDFSLTKLHHDQHNPPNEQHMHRFAGPLMSIRAIPNADSLHKLQPQTMTVNIIAGIIGNPTARTVKVRRRGNYDMDIIELALGDDTKAGFPFSSWHAPLTSQSAEDALRRTLQSLRPQDIVLIERLALSSFRGQVFGQTLARKPFTNTATSITVLHRAESRCLLVPDRPVLLAPDAAAKLQKVKDWVTSFIGPGNTSRNGVVVTTNHHRARTANPRLDQGEEHLPPDSQA